MGYYWWHRLVVLVTTLTAILTTPAMLYPLDKSTMGPVGGECQLGKRTFLSNAKIYDGCNNCTCTEGVVACLGGPITCTYLQGHTTVPPPLSCVQSSQVEGQDPVFRLDGEVFEASNGTGRCWCENRVIWCSTSQKTPF